MKTRPFVGKRFCKSQVLSLATLSIAGYANAASGNWLGSANTSWSDPLNWSASPVPGIGEIATFNGAGNGNMVIDLGGGVTIGSIIFDTASAVAYTIGSGAVGSQQLTLDNTAAVTMNSTVANNQLFNANLVLGTAVAATTTITNSTTDAGMKALTFAGTVQGGSGGAGGIKTINIAGTGTVSFTSSFSAGGATGINFAHGGSGYTILSGGVNSTFSELRSTGSGTLVIDNSGGEINVSAISQQGTGSRIELKAGTLKFNAGITTPNTATGTLIKVAGGAFTASSVSLTRTGGSDTDTATTGASTGAGLVVTGGTALITGALNLNGRDSSASSLVSGGELTVNGETNIGNNSTGTARWFRLQVSGGSFISKDTTNGIILARHDSQAFKASLLLTGGTTTVEKISFGLGTTNIGSQGQVNLNGATAALFLGSGGMVQNAGTGYVSTINLTNGLLGAKANWSSSLPMNINGGVTIKTADAADVARNITLTGALSGAGAITKTGGGVLALGTGNTAYTGQVTVDAGVLQLDHSNAAQNNTIVMNVANGLGFGSGITTATIGGLSGSGNLTLTNTGAGAVVLSVGNNNANTTYSGAFSGAGSLKKIGSGSLTLGGTNSGYTNGIALDSGVLSVNSSSAAGSNTNTISAVNGTRIHAGSGLGSNTAQAAILLSGTNANVALSNSNASGGFSSAFTGSVDQILTISSAGGQAVNLNANSKQLQNFYGTVSVPAATSLGFRSTSLNNGSDNALFDINGSMHTRNNGNLALGALSGSGVLGMGGSGNPNSWLTYTIGARNTSTTFSGVIQDGDTATGKRVAVTKTGSAVLTLSGSTTYSGNTTVSAGTLRVNGTHTGGGDYVVNANATLGGTGQITLAASKSVTVNASATLAPGASIGVLTLDAPTVTLAADSNLVIEVDNSGGIISDADQLVIGSSATAINIGGAELSFDFVSPTTGAVTQTTPVVIVNNQSSTNITTDFKNMPRDGNGSFSKLTGVLKYTLYYTYDADNKQTTGGNDIAIQFTAVPEPSAGILLMGAVLGCRRKRSAGH